MEWYFAKDGGQVGPRTNVELQALLGAGEISGGTLVWHEGLADWQSLDSIQPEWFGNDIPTRAPEVAGEPLAACAVSGAELPQSELLRYGDVWVAPENKDVFLQGLREGVSTKGENPASGGYTFQNPQGRATWAKSMMIGFSVLSVLGTLVELVAPESAPEEFTAMDGFLAMIGLLILVAFILSVVFFSMWTHRVVSNAYALGGEWMEITPGWAVGWYFIPFANLIKPYRALKQAWQTTFQTEDVSTVMPVWWGCWLVTNFLGNISFRLTLRGEFEASLGVDLISAVFEIGNLIAIIMIVNRMTQAQIARAAE